VTTTIYRKCTCRETAHDLKFELAAHNASSKDRYVFACRNCGELARDRKGTVKLYRRAS
jgi:hypothetical protein